MALWVEFLRVPISRISASSFACLPGGYRLPALCHRWTGWPTGPWFDMPSDSHVRRRAWLWWPALSTTTTLKVITSVFCEEHYIHEATSITHSGHHAILCKTNSNTLKCTAIHCDPSFQFQHALMSHCQFTKSILVHQKDASKADCATW